MESWDDLVARGKVKPMGTAANLMTAIYLTFVGITATMGNSLVCYVILRSKKLRRRPHNMLLVNMAFSDLCITFFGYPYTTISGYANKYIFGWVYCQMQGFLTFTFAQSSMNTLAVISIYRYITICKPHKNYKLTIPVTQFVVFLTWCYTVLWTAPPLFGWSTYTIEPFGTSCSLDWTSTKDADVAYDYCLIVSCYLIHVIIMSFCYYKIVKQSGKLGNIKKTPMNVDEAKSMHKMKVEMKVTVMCLTVVIVFTVVWSPYTFVCLWSIYDPTLPVWVTTLPTMFAKLSSMLNPFIYVATNKSFNTAARDICSCKRNKMCLTVVIVFTVVWSPYTFVCLWSIYDPTLPVWVTTLPTMFAKLSSMLNPFIYVATNKSFNTAARDICSCKRNKVNPVQPYKLRRQKTEKEIYTINRTKEGIYIGEAEVKLSTRDATFF